MLRTALHVTLTPLVFMFVALIAANRLEPPAGLVVILGAAALGALYGWKNRHR
jgi:positive regulator of sigma E activity